MSVQFMYKAENMRLNAQTDMALRMMMYLSAKRDGPVTIQEMSRSMSLSQTHMMRVAAKLTSCGLLSSSRGRTGGISLGKDPHDVTVEDVIIAIEPDFNLVQCFGGGECILEPACLLKKTLTRALEAFFAELRSTSIFQLTKQNRGQLLHILRIEDVGRKRHAINRPKTASSGQPSLR